MSSFITFWKRSTKMFCHGSKQQLFHLPVCRGLGCQELPKTTFCSIVYQNRQRYPDLATPSLWLASCIIDLFKLMYILQHFPVVVRIKGKRPGAKSYCHHPSEQEALKASPQLAGLPGSKLKTGTTGASLKHEASARILLQPQLYRFQGMHLRIQNSVRKKQKTFGEVFS